MSLSTDRILIVESDRKRAETISDLCSGLGDFRIDSLSRVDEAVDWVARYNPRLVVFGSGSVASGAEMLSAVERLKRARPTTGVLVISSSASVEEAVSAMRIGADDYLAEGSGPLDVRSAAKRVIERSAAYDRSGEAGELLDLMMTCQLISSSGEEKSVLDLVRGYVARVTGSDIIGVFIAESHQAPRLLKTDGNDPRRDESAHELIEIAVQSAHPFEAWPQGGSDVYFAEKGHLTPSLFLYRFRWSIDRLYYFVALAPRSSLARTEIENRFRMLRFQIEAASRNLVRFEGVHRLAYVDDVTGLYNSRYLDDLLDREIEQSKRTARPFAMLFIDIDYFKQINDRHGHLVGSHMLRVMGEKFKKFVRSGDTIFRYGGDEFIAVLPDCGIEMASMVAERIRAVTEKEIFNTGDEEQIQVTLSIGIALYPDHADSKRALMEAADHAMYSAKRGSRNAVSLAEFPSATASPGLKVEMKKKAKPRRKRS